LKREERRLLQSHSGLVIKIGESTVYAKTVYAKTSKQRLVTKSSTEAELVCASDGVPIIYYIRDWLLEKTVDQINLFQDNMSTIYLINNEKSSPSRRAWFT
jgi:hypothetical protein